MTEIDLDRLEALIHENYADDAGVSPPTGLLRWASATIRALTTRAEAAEAEAKGLREALEPFKSVAELLAVETEGFEADDKFKLCIVDDRDGKTITVSDDLTHGHFRTALEASR